jgi:single-strand DNA-binding protein
MRCAIWRQPAEHVAESLRCDDRVIVAGRLRQRSFETSDGDKRTVVELDVDEVGPSLRYATVKSKVVATEQRQDGGRPSDDDEPPF